MDETTTQQAVPQAMPQMQVSQPAAPTPAPQKMNMWPWVLVMLVLLGVVGAGGYYLGAQGKNNYAMQHVVMGQVSPTGAMVRTTQVPTATPTPDPTANWQTYKNEPYHFSIMLPADYRKIDESTRSLTLNSSVFEVDFVGKVVNDGIRVEAFSNPTQISAADFVKTVAFKNDLPGWNNASRPTQVIPLLGTDAIRIERITGGVGDYGPVLFVSQLSFTYKISAMNLSQTNADVFNQAIQTFKFFQ